MIKRLLPLLLLTVTGATGPAGLVNGDVRPAVELSGPWHWSVDPYRDGLAGFHGEEPGRGHQRYADVDPETEATKNPRVLFEQDMLQSPVVTLPGSWIGHDQSMRYYDGLVWYRRAFNARPKPGKRYFLRFGAADYRADVYVNGKKAGEHEGGFTPFALEVTDLLRAGSNQVTVGVDSQRSWDAVPPSVTDWENYGGITRPVRLVETPANYIDDAWVRLTRDGRLRATVTVRGATAQQNVRVRIASLGLTMSGRTGEDGTWTGEVPAPRGLRRWSPESPTLYPVTVEAGEDRFDDRIGFRTLEVRGNDMLLNGKPIFLRGICLHEEELGVSPVRAITPAAGRALLSEVKNGLHGNFVRLAHYPHSEVMTRLADEMGLIVWSEIPVYWRVNFGRPETLALAKNMQRENILRDRNRASIAFWSVGNETPISPERTAFLTALVAEARALDDTRLMTAALLNRREQKDGHAEMVIDDPLIPALDVMAVNTYNGWYSDDALSTLPTMTWRTDAVKPLIFSEFGADAK
ncbi:MAG: glycoside hydrolase family 2 protein, partial [Sphingomicrobium sp.]